MMKELIIIGASGHSKVVSEIALLNNVKIIGYLDDDISKPNVIGKISDAANFSDKNFIIAIGNNNIREKIVTQHSELNYINLIHPTAVISETAKIGTGNVVMANAVLNAEASIGSHCIINTASVVEHECVLEDFIHISPGAVLCGTVKVGRLTHIGANAVVKNNVSVAEECVIGVGAAVVKNINKPGVYVGVPARELVKK